MEKLKFKDITGEFMAAEAKENPEVRKWLVAECKKTIQAKVYPKVKNEKGKWVADRTQPYKLVERKITLKNVAHNFAEKFHPEALEKPEKAPTFFDVVDMLDKFSAQIDAAATKDTTK